MDVITYPCRDSNQSMLVKASPVWNVSVLLYLMLSPHHMKVRSFYQMYHNSPWLYFSLRCIICVSLKCIDMHRESSSLFLMTSCSLLCVPITYATIWSPDSISLVRTEHHRFIIIQHDCLKAFVQHVWWTSSRVSKCLLRYILSTVCLRFGSLSRLSALQFTRL